MNGIRSTVNANCIDNTMKGAMTLSIMTLSIKTLSMMSFCITTLSMKPFSITTLSKMAFSITTLSINDILHNNNLPLC